MDVLAFVAAIAGIVAFVLGRLNLGWACWLAAWMLQIVHLTTTNVHG